MSTPPLADLTELRDRLRVFAEERAWQNYHSPKNLVMALSVEAAELLEPFQWLSAEESRQMKPAQQQAVKEEIADVLIYLTRLADVLGIDLLDAAAEKLAKNAVKYPVARAHGNADKYDTFSE